MLRWTCAEFHRLAEHGFFNGRDVQLIQGEIFAMSPAGPRHATAVTLTALALQAALPAGTSLRVQQPLELSQTTDPEPDLAMVSGSPRQYASQHPTTALLVVEVADASLDHDRTTKMSLYAAAGIPVYWVVNLPHDHARGLPDSHGRPTAAFRPQLFPGGYLPLRGSGDDTERAHGDRGGGFVSLR